MLVRNSRTSRLTEESFCAAWRRTAASTFSSTLKVMFFTTHIICVTVCFVNPALLRIYLIEATGAAAPSRMLYGRTLRSLRRKVQEISGSGP